MFDDSIKLDPIAARYVTPILRIVQTYPPGHAGLLPALAQLCHTAHSDGHKAGVDAAASKVCEGLHAGPPTGLKCRQCYEAEANFSAESQVLAEMELKRREDEGEAETLLVGEILEDE